MIYLKNFNESNSSIDSICGKYGIKNYTINEDGSIDVDGDVLLQSKGLKSMPLKFRNVTGNFTCCSNELKTLEGCPIYVSDNFNCDNNQLKTLEGGPERVEGEYSCDYNQLITLEGAPEYVGGDFNCSGNKITSLEFSPKKVGGSYFCRYNKIVNLNGVTVPIGDRLHCFDNPIYNILLLFSNRNDFLRSMDYSYLRGDNIIKGRFKDALDEFNIKMPDKIEGYNYI